MNVGKCLSTNFKMVLKCLWGEGVNEIKKIDVASKNNL